MNSHVFTGATSFTIFTCQSIGGSYLGHLTGAASLTCQSIPTSLDVLVKLLFIVADRQLHHLRGVPNSSWWLKKFPHFWSKLHFLSGPFSYLLTALVVEALKLVLSFVCAVSNANCIVNIAITLNFE